MLIILTLCISQGTASAENKSYLKARDILLVYDDELSPKARDNLAAMADILTYMDYGTSYSTITKSYGLLDKFDNILFYHESETVSNIFVEELKRLNNKIMVIGGGDVGDILRGMNLNYTSISIEDTTVEFSYSSNGVRESAGLLKADNVTVIEGKLPDSFGQIKVGEKTAPLCMNSGRFSCMALFDSGSDVLKAVFSDQISKWKWPFENLPNSYPQHIIFDNVYPFFDNQKMLKVIELLNMKGVPYSITVMPVYQNADYPAMKHFCEVLRYAQTKGATVIIKAPIVNTAKPALEDINKRISTAVSAYLNYGVYPIAIEVPYNWIHEELGRDVLKRFSTVVLYEDNKKNSWTDKEGYNSIYSDGHHFIAPAILEGDVGNNLINTYPTAIFLDINSDINTLEKQIDMIRASEVTLKSLWASSHSVYTEDKVISFKNNILSVNGRVQSMEFTPFSYESSFNYNRGVIGRLAESIARENRRLLIIVSGISIIFIFFIAVARYQNRKRFLINNNSDHGYDGGEQK